MPSPDVQEEMATPASIELSKRELYVPHELAPVDGEAAVLSMLVVRDGSEWRVVAGSLLTVPVAVASTSTRRWGQIQLLAAEDSTRSTEDEEALAKAQVLVDELEHRYGSAFLTDYGWAADAVAGSEHRGFRAIEHAADFGHLRFNYRSASGGIHASAGMVLTPPDARDPYSTMIAGPSLLAIATPAHAVALTLCVSTSTLLTSTPNSAGVFVISAMSDIASRAGDLLAAAEAGVEQCVAAETAIQEDPERDSE
jgi:hypothetical protein